MKRDIQVVYIGRSVNMRKRIAEHLRGKNSLLYHHLTNYSCWVRFIPLARDETVANEKRLFDEYLRIFGSRPTCNRIRP